MSFRSTLRVNMGGIVIVGAICLIAAVLVIIGARSLSTITRSEDAAAVFNDAAVLPDELRDTVEWLEDAPDLPRVMDPRTRENITSAWLRAWAQIPIVETTGDTTGLEVYFSGPALTAMNTQSGSWAGQGAHQLGHELRIEFFSEDGQVVALRSESSRFERNIGVAVAGPDNTEAALRTDEQYDAVLVLEDGNWRIRHLVRSSMTVENLDEDGFILPLVSALLPELEG